MYSVFGKTYNSLKDARWAVIHTITRDKHWASVNVYHRVCAALVRADKRDEGYSVYDAVHGIVKQ